MLYPENEKPTLDPRTFQSPGAEYRATPFWAWNCVLDQELLNREIDCMREMGFGGFHMHVRVGLTTEYLSAAFMDFIKNCTAYAKQQKMLAWLYDEDKWPSGFAGGLVTKDPRYRAKRLLLTARPLPEQGEASFTVPWEGWEPSGPLLATYAIALDGDGCLARYERLGAGQPPPQGALLRYAYLDAQAPSAWYNQQTYPDTLSPAAIQKFVEITHERYFAAVGGEFGKAVPAIFTDEPQVCGNTPLAGAFSREEASLPWTGDFADTYRDAYGEDLLDFLPELFWDLPEGGVSRARYRYHDHCAERFASAFADTVGSWCAQRGLMLTGHMMAEETLGSQTRCVEDCMRSYRSFQLPGIDMLCDRREFNTAKQAQSAARQYARPGVLSELYGVTNWNFRFRQHKLQGDWQAALGVSVRVPHLYWVSMRGEAKRDYPASIGHQSPWFRQYKHIEDHFARLNCVLTRGKPCVKIGVVHPIESYWLHWGPRAQARARQEEMEERFAQLTEWLLESQLDFDFISESLLPGLYDPQGEGFAVGAMHYDVVILPWLETIRRTTLDALGEFASNEGEVLFLGDLPEYIDAAEELGLPDVFGCLVNWSKTELLGLLEPYRLHSVTENGAPASNLLSQWRQDTDCHWLFLCHANDSARFYTNRPRKLQISIKGEWQAEKYDTLTGEITPLPCGYTGGSTCIDWAAYPQDSLLLRLVPGKSEVASIEEPAWRALGDLAPVVPVTLEEPNVLVLDMPEHSLDGGPWQPREEVLRLCAQAKEALGLENVIAHGCQPWVLGEDPGATPTHTLRLRYAVRSRVDVDCVRLGVEDLETLTITWNEAGIPPVAEGYYVDEAIQTVTLGQLRAGENLLEITVPFGKVTTVENCYLLGDFGVAVRGREAVVTEPVRELAFGDWVSQGLPFYGGNVVYHAALEADEPQPLAVEATHFEQPVLDVRLDGEDKGIIALSPWRAQLGTVPTGGHALDITAYGNRINTFGALHNCHYDEQWHGPGAWRTQGFEWTYEYRLRPGGILVAPRVLAETER